MNRDKLTRPGMTLVELLVAVAILVMMIAGVGYVFTTSSKAVRVTQATIETNAALRAAMGRLREDLQSLSKDGVLFICPPSENAGEPVPPMLMFTATGRFESRRFPGYTSNAALILYMPVRDVQGGPDILARYALLLTGDALQFPVSLRDALGGSPNERQLDWLCREDRLGASLTDVRVSATKPSTDNYGFWNQYVWPLLARYARLNSAPATVDYDTTAPVGGVANLWPYLVGGCVGFQTTFTDGRTGEDADGDDLADPVVPYPEAPVAWMDPAVPDVRDLRLVKGKPAPGLTAMPGHGQPAFIMWDSRNTDLWPDALRIRLELRDAGARLQTPRVYEAVFELP